MSAATPDLSPASDLASADTTVDRRSASALEHLHLLFSGSDDLIELRCRNAMTGRWSQYFERVSKLRTLARRALSLAPDHDVYVGVLPRRHPSGRRRDLAPTGHVVWTDLDRPDAGTVLSRFAPAPSLAVASGTTGHVHAYWHLNDALPLDVIEATNLALATQLGGDLHATDAPRILRLAGTFNHKHDPPTYATLLVPATGVRRIPRSVLRDALPAPVDLPPRVSQTGSSAPPPATDGPSRCRRACSPKVRALDAIPPAVYVATLTGHRVPERSRKVPCPLHADDTPSLHSYETAGEGWFCFGCRRGGSVYDLAAAMLDRPLRGPKFVELQRDLIEMLVDRTDHPRSENGASRMSEESPPDLTRPRELI